MRKSRPGSPSKKRRYHSGVTDSSPLRWELLADGMGAEAFRADGSLFGSVGLTYRELAAGEWRVGITLEWAHRAGVAELAAVADWASQTANARVTRGAAITLAIDVDADRTPAYRDLLPEVGFELGVAENEFRHDLTKLPVRHLDQGLVAHSWDNHSAPLFFHAYDGAFRDRPGFPGWDEARWTATMAGSADFRPDLSRVVLDGGEPAAFEVLWVEDRVGWIVQIGVRPEWRSRGLGEFLLAEGLRAFRDKGLAGAALEVATNNPHASALYERMGFRRAGGYESWRKRIR